jgi:mannose-6-phosphate isomerase
MDDGLYRLVGRIQNYAWGGHEFIPRLLGLQPEPHTPYAEYWLGAHIKAPAKVILNDDSMVYLDELVAEHPRRVLGPHAASKYGQLPYLFKVLDVEEPLSIQVHPTRPQAEAGFARENELGIPLDSPRRNYKDDNHKPELMVALSDFWLLHGFLPEAQLSSVLRGVPEFHGLLGVFEAGGYAGLYSRVTTLPSEEVDAILGPLVERVRSMSGTDGWEKSSPEYWVARAVADRSTSPFDRGLFSIYFFNLVKLRAGQGIFQDAGVPHAYLQGQNIEVMANSDNVLRGGLTAKHVDVPELLRTVSFEGISPAVIEGTRTDSLFEALYQSPTEDFRLSRIDLRKGDTYVNSAESVEIVLVMAGAAAMGSDGKRLHLGRGRSAVVVSGTDYRITADSEDVTLFRVSLP